MSRLTTDLCLKWLHQMPCNMLISSCSLVSTELADLDTCLQMGAIDLQAMAMALGCCWVPPINKMNRHKPTPHTCTLKGLLLMISAAIGMQVTHIGLMLFMSTRPAFLAGTGTAYLVSCPFHIKHRNVSVSSIQLLAVICGVCFMFLQSEHDGLCKWHLHGLSLHHIFSWWGPCLHCIHQSTCACCNVKHSSMMREQLRPLC